MTPGVDSCVREVTVDGVPQGSLTTYTFTNITSNHTINVEFRELFRITGSIQPYKARALYGGAGFWQAYDTATGGTLFTTGGWLDHQQNVTIADCTVNEITVEFQAQAGWRTPDPQTITITDNTTVEGEYLPQLTVVSSNGRVTSVPAGIDCGGDCDEIYAVDTMVTLTAVADVAGYVFDEFQDDASGPLSPTQVFMDEPKTVTAVFVPETPGNEDADGDGWSIDDGDCDDTNAQVYPGAVEQCTAVDFDCDGLTASTTPVDPDCQDLALADTPLETQLQAAPANIMFVLDNSGSMDWEFSTTEPNGLFEWEYYIFDDPGDNAYWGQILDATQRRKYRSQWNGYNRMYYNPAVNYTTWPLGDGTRYDNADPDNPRSNPESSAHTLNLSNSFVTMAGTDNIDIINAHYFTWNDANSDGIVDNGEIYLIELEDPINYYQFVDSDADNEVDVAGELIDVSGSPPAGIVTGRTYDEERQNFANWYSFYRKRELTAKAAVGEVIDNLKGVQVGFYTINQWTGHGIRHGVKKVRVTEDDGSGNKIYTDHTATLLHDLYDINSAGGTPLRTALNAVGQYYEAGGWDGGLGSPPWYADASGDCQQSFTIVMTDGYYNGGNPGVSNIPDGDGNQTGVTDPDGDELYADSYGETLADVAMYYYKNDLDGDTTNNRVPPNFADTAEHQHMVTYSVSFGVVGTLDPDNYDLDNANPALRDYPVWPDPNTSDATKIDDMWHAAVNGRGLYLNAANPEELVASLLEIMLNLTSRIGAGASLSINGEELYAGTTMFQASYSTDGWTGDVFAYSVNTTTGEVVTGEGNAIWTGATMLGRGSDWNAVSWDTGREIATFDPVAETGITFRWAELTAAQQAFLNDNPATGAVDNDGRGSARLEYLRGNNTQEEQNGGTFRDRFSKLGDIVHSSPLYEGYDTDNDGVDNYGMLYVGANDGMLHAFDANTGQEKFAYVPNLVFENLNGLSLPEPDFRHRYFVDLTPLVKNIGTAAAPNKLLVGGLGKGGKGYYCLNVTNANTISEGDVSWVKWEYPRQTSPATEKDNMGYSYSRASIVKSYVPGHPWVVIFGNGYGSANESSVLYILDASTGAFLRMIDTGTSGNGNGMSHAVPVDIDGDFKVDFVYAGDLSGNMWKFDLRDPDYDKWGSAFGDNDINLDGIINPIDGETPKPLFRAMGREKEFVNLTYTGATTWAQPITTQPIIIRHCVHTKPGYLVLFGTGKYLADIDANNSEYQTIYGIWDYGEEVKDYYGDFKRGVGPSGEDEFSNPIHPSSATLLQQSVQWWGPNPYNANQNLRILTQHEPDWEQTLIEETPKVHAGWYFDLPLDKERVVRDPVYRNGILIIITSRPENDPCSAGGRSIIHEMDSCSGGRLDSPQFDINDDGVIDDSDLVRISNPLWGQPDEPEFLWVPPTGMEVDAMIFPPVILIMPDEEREIKYFVTAGGGVVAVTEVADQRGLFFWRYVRQ
jgi:type IV pilus assembly protein PilY1